MRSTAAVLGSPISHSLSPVIHNFAYKQLGITAEYIAVEVKESEFLDWIRSALSQSDQWIGFSLTMPLKEIVCSPQLHDLVTIDEISSEIGAANTLYRRDGRWMGCSTDVFGFEFLLKEKEFRSIGILGAGGTARSALAALHKLKRDRNFEVSVFRRSAHRDERLKQAAGDLPIQIEQFDSFQKAEKFDLVINTVPNPGVVDLAESFLGCGVLLDAVYSPWPTAFMARQQRDNLPLITGIELLCAQALPQIRLMTQASFDDADLYPLLLEQAKAALS